MRIGIDGTGLLTSQAGIRRYLSNMVTSLPPSEDDVFLYAPGPAVGTVPEGRWRLRLDHHLPAGSVNLWVQQRLPKLLAGDRIEVFWAPNNLLPVRMLHRCATLFTLHDLTPILFPSTMPARTRLALWYQIRLAARRADRIIAVSAATARLARLCLGVREARLRIVHEGADPAFRPVPVDEARSLVEASYGLRGEYMLVVGTIEPRKDLMVLLRAIEDAQPAPTLVIAGGVGWRCRREMASIRTAEARGLVRYIGRVPDGHLAALYSSARLLVYPSRYEGFGLPVLEAMTCGCPVLCSWSSSLPEVGGSAARYFRAGDPVDLSRVLALTLNDDAGLARMSADGAVRASSFSFRRAARQLLGMMHEFGATSSRGRRTRPSACPTAGAGRYADRR